MALRSFSLDDGWIKVKPFFWATPHDQFSPFLSDDSFNFWRDLSRHRLDEGVFERNELLIYFSSQENRTFLRAPVGCPTFWLDPPHAPFRLQAVDGGVGTWTSGVRFSSFTDAPPFFCCGVHAFPICCKLCQHSYVSRYALCFFITLEHVTPHPIWVRILL